MIGKLSGTIDTLGTDQVLIDVQGVGYEVFCATSTLSTLQVGAPAALYIFSHVREDHFHLYGFASQEEKAWFETLISVQGVGPKVGLAILSTLTPFDLANALMLEDKRPFQSVSGVGPKVAARLVTELKEKSPKVSLTAAGTSGVSAQKSALAPGLTGTAAQLRDLISALTNLGYDEGSARTAAQTAIADMGEDADLNALIPAALKVLAP